MTKKNEELRFQLELSTLTKMTEKIDNLETNVKNIVDIHNRTLKSCMDMAAIVTEQRIRIEQLERLLSIHR